MPTYKLHYFDLRARGELARMVLNTAGQDFEDIRISFEEWPKVKSSFPTGQLPLLEIDDLKLSQSMAIARYLAREYGYAGKDNMEQALVDQVVDTVTDLMDAFYKFNFESDAAKKAEMSKVYYEETAPRLLGVITKFLEQNNNGDNFFVGDSLTIADMAAYDALETLVKAESGFLSKFSKLEAHRKIVASQPKIGDYLKKRPDTDV